ncbi:hypothetical protein PJE062_4698 [Pseudovibrio sp. JE062]|nr:hypothetical protein PJE062_4698 [Pseudovibrio sp. JE062]
MLSEADEGISFRGLDFWFAGGAGTVRISGLSYSFMGGFKVQLRQRLQTRFDFPSGFPGR